MVLHFPNLVELTKIKNLRYVEIDVGLCRLLKHLIMTMIIHMLYAHLFSTSIF
ncbi:unnamed protein product, partial [Candidula unifasciata]